jgi:hypothetical protein
MSRIVDTSRSKCRTCGKPYKVGDSIYSLASVIVDEGDQRFLEEFEHASCHVPIDEAIRDLRQRLNDLAAKTRF